MIGECFIATPGGAKVITDLQPGDLLYSYKSGFCLQELKSITRVDDVNLFRFVCDNHTIGYLSQEHKILLRDESWMELYSVPLKMSMMSFLRSTRGKEWSLYLPNGDRIPEHQFIANQVGMVGEHIHHINGDHQDNHVENLIGITREEHEEIHRQWRNEKKRKMTNALKDRIITSRAESWRQWFHTLSDERKEEYFEKLQESKKRSNYQRLKDGSHNFLSDNPMNDPEKIELMKKMKVASTAYKLKAMELPIDESSWDDSVKCSGFYKSQCFRSVFVKELFGNWFNFEKFLNDHNTKLILLEFDYKGFAFSLGIESCVICDAEMRHGVVVSG